MGQNLLRNFYELGQTEARQILILNLSMNQISSLQEVALCTNLQFLNLAHNKIKDADEVNRLRKLANLQELYLSHNKVDFQFSKDMHEVGGGPSRRNYQAIWPALEVLDLTQNRCSDLSQIEFLFSAQFVIQSVIKVIGLAGNFTDMSQDQLSNRLSEEKCPQQLDFQSNYIDILQKYSQFAHLNEDKLVKACIGVQYLDNLGPQLLQHRQKIRQEQKNIVVVDNDDLDHSQSKKSKNNHLQLSPQANQLHLTSSAVVDLSKNPPISLNWLKRGGVGTGQAGGGGGQTAGSKTQANPSKETLHGSEDATQAKIKTIMPTKKLVVSSDAANKASNNAVGGVKSQTNFLKIPHASSQVSQSKKRLLRILSPNHRENNINNNTTKLFSKEVNPQYSTKNIGSGTQQQMLISGLTTVGANAAQLSSKDSQAGKSSQISANQSEKKFIKMKRVHVTKIKNGPRKPGVKQIQMVYLNPSHGSSRRSPSMQSQRSHSKNSADKRQTSSGQVQLIELQQENSIQQAYGGGSVGGSRGSKQQQQQQLQQKQQQQSSSSSFKQFNNQSTSQATTANNFAEAGSTNATVLNMINRNKSISNCQSKQRVRMLSPKNKITPRFDSYETLPKQGVVNYPMTNVLPSPSNHNEQPHPLLLQQQQSQVTMMSQTTSTKNKNQRQNNAGATNPKTQGKQGVSQGLSTYNPNALKISLPANTSPPIKKSVAKSGDSNGLQLSPTFDKDVAGTATKHLNSQHGHAQSTTQASSNVVRVKFKNKAKQHLLAAHAGATTTSHTKSSAAGESQQLHQHHQHQHQTHSHSTESEKTSSCKLTSTAKRAATGTGSGKTAPQSSSNTSSTATAAKLRVLHNHNHQSNKNGKSLQHHSSNAATSNHHSRQHQVISSQNIIAATRDHSHEEVYQNNHNDQAFESDLLMQDQLSFGGGAGGIGSGGDGISNTTVLSHHKYKWPAKATSGAGGGPPSSSDNNSMTTITNIVTQQPAPQPPQHQKRSSQPQNRGGSGRKTPLKYQNQYHNHNNKEVSAERSAAGNNSVHQRREKSNSARKSGSQGAAGGNIGGGGQAGKTAISQISPFSGMMQNSNTSSSMKQMTLSQNASTLLQNLQMKNKKSLLNMKSQAITAQQTRKLKIMANMTAASQQQPQQQQNHSSISSTNKASERQSAQQQSNSHYHHQTDNSTTQQTQSHMQAQPQITGQSANSHLLALQPQLQQSTSLSSSTVGGGVPLGTAVSQAQQSQSQYRQQYAASVIVQSSQHSSQHHQQHHQLQISNTSAISTSNNQKPQQNRLFTTSTSNNNNPVGVNEESGNGNGGATRMMRNLFMGGSSGNAAAGSTTHGTGEKKSRHNRNNSDENCEAMIACENLPSEPLMPRSHKSSARSFLKNFGHFGGATSVPANQINQNNDINNLTQHSGSYPTNNMNNNMINNTNSNTTTYSKSFLKNLSSTTNSRQASCGQGQQPSSKQRYTTSQTRSMKPPLK